MPVRKKSSSKKHTREDDQEIAGMYDEYREENAKDLAREGIGNW